METLQEPVALYTRVSTTEQAKEGYSITEQEERLKSYCAAMGMPHYTVFSDPGFSGATLDRPGIQELIRSVRQGKYKRVIVWKLDRLSRSQKDTLVLLEDVLLASGCNFTSLMESFDTSTPFGRCIVGILAAFAQMERENIKSRMMMGKQAGAKAGRYFSGKTPYGYKKEPGPEGKPILVPEQNGRAMISGMFERYTSGYSLYEVGKWAQAEYGYCAGQDPQSVETQVRRTLLNPVYTGRVSYQGQLYDGRHEALVSQELWDAAGSRIRRNIKEVKRTYPKSDGLLSGLLYCGDCGARMSIREWGWKSGKAKCYVCYSVSRGSVKMIRSDNCTNRRVHPIGELDGIILDQIRLLSVDPSRMEDILERSIETRTDPAPAGYKERLKEVEKQIGRLMNLYQTGIMDLEELSPRLTRLKEEREALEEEIRKAEELPAGALDLEDARESLSSLARILDQDDKAALFSLVHKMVSRIVILNEEITIHWAFCPYNK